MTGVKGDITSMQADITEMKADIKDLKQKQDIIMEQTAGLTSSALQPPTLSRVTMTPSNS